MPSKYVILQNLCLRVDFHVFPPPTSQYATPAARIEVTFKASVTNFYAGASTATFDLITLDARLCLHTTERYTAAETSLMSTENFIRIEK
jgi:hypothetical protein